MKYHLNNKSDSSKNLFTYYNFELGSWKCKNPGTYILQEISNRKMSNVTKRNLVNS